MDKASSQSLKDELIQFVRSLGAYKLQVADARTGFDNAIDGCHPRDVMENCNSVVVFGIYVGSDYYRSIKTRNEITANHRIVRVFRDWLQYRLVDYLEEKGYETMIPLGFYDRESMTVSLSYKLAAFEAGLGVYGKCGIIITPEYGPRVNFGVVLTDAILEPDPKLVNFDPCNECRVCIDLCPPKAIREDLSTPKSHVRLSCVNFILRLREKTGDKNFLCGYCYGNCPIGKPTKRGFILSRHRTLMGLRPDERGLLMKETHG